MPKRGWKPKLKESKAKEQRLLVLKPSIYACFVGVYGHNKGDQRDSASVHEMRQILEKINAAESQAMSSKFPCRT